MMTTVKRRVATGALLLIVPLVGACGFDARTDQPYQAATGTNERTINGVDVLNALVVSAKNGQGTFGGTLALPDNEQKPVQLVSISEGTINGTVTVKPGEVVNLATTGAVRMQGADIVAGRFVPMTLTFSDGKTVRMNVPIVDHSGPYASVPVGASPPSASGRPVMGGTKAPAQVTASATATPSATESPAPTASPSAG